MLMQNQTWAEEPRPSISKVRGEGPQLGTRGHGLRQSCCVHNRDCVVVYLDMDSLYRQAGFELLHIYLPKSWDDRPEPPHLLWDVWTHLMLMASMQRKETAWDCTAGWKCGAESTARALLPGINVYGWSPWQQNCTEILLLPRVPVLLQRKANALPWAQALALRAV